MSKLMYLWIAVKTVFCTCQPDHKINGFEKVKSHYKITKIGKLPTAANESSGLAKGKDPDSFWTHNDSGGKAELYEINSEGKLLSTKQIDDAPNIDWEDLTTDPDGAVYIGDFGNNGNNRKSLNIYKLANEKSVVEKISFHYADQKDFPPSSAQFNYDCEAFFYSNKNLYLFSKNGMKTSHFVKLYQLASQPGNYSISPIDSIQINTQVTSADISPDGKTFALLTYGKVLLFGIERNRINFGKPLGCFKLVKKQAEALIFLNNTDMLITNEQRQIFRVTHR